MSLDLKKTSVFIALFLMAFPALANDNGNFGVGVNYGLIGNFRMWDNASTEAGSVLRIEYFYDLNHLYTIAAEIGFVADNNVFRNVAETTAVQTASFLIINNLFHLSEVWSSSPYLKIGTGLYAVNAWNKRTDQKFYYSGTNVFVDLSAGAGTDFYIGNIKANMDLFFPALLNEWFGKLKLSYILSFGCKYGF